MKTFSTAGRGPGILRQPALEAAGISGKTCVITGATSGLGKAAAQKLGALGANLVLTGRNERAGRDIVGTLRRRYPSITVDYIRADLSRQADVRLLASTIVRDHPTVDVLLNNAGARFDRYGQTPDGVERTFATNHLGHFLLTHLLAENLLRAPAARVVTVSSGAHRGATAEGGWQLTASNYDRRLAYAKSKLANVMFAYELARRLRHTRVSSNVVDPGGVATHFARNNGTASWIRHLVGHALSRDLIFTGRGARPLIHLAVAANLLGLTERYFCRTGETKSSPASYDIDEAKRLWELSVGLMGLGGHSLGGQLTR